MAIVRHNAFRPMNTYNVACTSGAANSTAVFGSQTRYLRLASIGNTTFVIGYYYQIGEAPVASSLDSALSPANVIEFVKCTPGQRISIRGAATAPTVVYVTEMTD